MHSMRQRVPDHVWKTIVQPQGDRLARAGAQERSGRGVQPITDGHNLVGGLALAEDNLGVALAQRAVVIDPCERQIFEREVSQPLECRCRRNTTGGNVREQGLELLGGHATWATGSRYSRKIASASAMDSI